MLTTRTPSCFSSEYVLLDQGRPCGRFTGRMLSSSIDVSLLKRYRLVFEHHGIFSSRYTLTDKQTNAILGGAQHAGLFSSAWDLSLTIGDCQLVSAGWFNQGFVVEHGQRQIAQVNVASGCDGSWYVNPTVDLTLTDQVMIGLVFHTILRRRRQRRSNASR